MKKAAFRAIFCYLLCLALVADYSSLKAYRSEIDDYDFAPVSYFSYNKSRVSITSNGIVKDWFLTNAEGQKLCNIFARSEALFLLLWNSDLTEAESKAISNLLKPNHEYYGDIKYYTRQPMGGHPSVTIPFTNTVTTQAIPIPERRFSIPDPKDGMTFWEFQKELSELYYNHWIPSFCSAAFYNKDKEIAAIYVNGFSGSIIFHSDNSVELYGDTRDITVQIREEGTKWTVSGSGGLYAKIAVVDGEIEVEGLTSYEVEREEGIFD